MEPDHNPLYLIERDYVGRSVDAINSGPGLWILYGSHTPLDAATLAQLYQNHHTYVSAVSDVNDDNVKAGYILSEDADANIFEAAHSGILKH